MNALGRETDRQTIVKFLLLGVLLGILLVLIANFVPYGVDWRNVFRPAARAIFNLNSPFSISGYFNAPWAVVALIPLALLPENYGYALLVLLSLAGFAYTAYRLGGKQLAVIAILLSPPVLHSLLNGNIDALSVIGFVLPPQIGLFFVLIKPQIGIAVAFYWLVEAWRKDRAREVLHVFGPVTSILLISFLFFGLWPLQFEQEIDLWWNTSLWPASIPVGLVLLVVAIRRRRMEFAMAASPCLSPYVLLHAWVGALLAVVSHLPETIAAVIGLWLLVLMQA